MRRLIPIFLALVLVAIPLDAFAAFANLFGRIIGTDANSVTLVSGHFTTTAAINSADLIGDLNVMQVTYHVYSTQAGTAQVQVYPITGSPVSVSDGAIAITASTLKTIVLGFAAPKTRIVFTPSASDGDDDIWIDGYVTSGGRR